MSRVALSLVLALASLAGCSDDKTMGSGGAGGAAGMGGTPGEYTEVASLSIGPFTLNPGQEVTKCVTRRMPTTTDTDITRIESSLEPGSHHLIYYTANETSESLEPTDCQPFNGILQGTVPLYIAESREAFLNFPTGVSYT